jgi:hypothetical protein
MAFCSDSRKTRHRSGYSSGEEDALIQNQSKIVTYGVQRRWPSGVRMCSLFHFFVVVRRSVRFIMHRKVEW